MESILVRDCRTSWKGRLDAMRRHLEDTEPALNPLMSETYERGIQELQADICDYLLQQEQKVA